MGAGTIAGQVRTAAGDPVAGAPVLIESSTAGHIDIAALSDADGGYRFDDLAPGRYELLVNAEGYPPARRVVEVEAGGLAHLDFVLRR